MEITEKRPVIGISGFKESPMSTSWVDAMIAQVRAAGGEPVFIDDHDGRKPADDLARMDALIVMGNEKDIDPAKYGMKRDPKTNIETNLARAAYEEAAIRMAMDKGMPVLGICGGMQRMNVLGGGTLNQNVEGHLQKEPLSTPTKTIFIAPNTRLSAVLGYEPKGRYGRIKASSALVNNSHRQSIEKLRGDFRVSARTGDRVVEAIESTDDRFAVGIQWHPEEGSSKLDRGIVKALVAAATKHAAEKEANPDLWVNTTRHSSQQDTSRRPG